MRVREITRGKGKLKVIAWYEIVPSGHRFQQISQQFDLDGVRYEPGSYIVKKADATYATAMTDVAFARWCQQFDGKAL